MTVGSRDFSFGGFCCFSCVASHQFLADLGIWCHNTGSSYQCNVKLNGRAASIDRHRIKCEIRTCRAPCHICSVIFKRRSATPPHVHNQCVKCESCELPALRVSEELCKPIDRLEMTSASRWSLPLDPARIPVADVRMESLLRRLTLHLLSLGARPRKKLTNPGRVPKLVDSKLPFSALESHGDDPDLKLLLQKGLERHRLRAELPSVKALRNWRIDTSTICSLLRSKRRSWKHLATSTFSCMVRSWTPSSTAFCRADLMFHSHSLQLVKCTGRSIRPFFTRQRLLPCRRVKLRWRQSGGCEIFHPQGHTTTCVFSTDPPASVLLPYFGSAICWHSNLQTSFVVSLFCYLSLLHRRSSKQNDLLSNVFVLCSFESVIHVLSTTGQS